MSCKECMYFDKQKELCLIDLVEASEQGKNCRAFKSFEEVPEQMSEDKIKKELEELRKQYEELNDFSKSQCAKLLMRNQILELAIGENMIHAVDKLEELRNQLSEIKKTFRDFEDAVADDNKSEELWQKLKILLS